MESSKSPEPRKGTYRHFKTGDLYVVIGTALHTETGEALVVYKPLYDHESDYEFFARPLEMFTGAVERDGEILARFTCLED